MQIPNWPLKTIAYSLIFASASAWAITVNNEAQLQAALSANASGQTIEFGSNINLTGPLPVIGLPSTNDILTIDGNGFSLIGNNTNSQAFFIHSGDITIQDLTISDCVSKGSDGGSAIFGAGAGGGTAGQGGAVFVNSPNGAVTLVNVNLNGNKAIGGAGGNSTGPAQDGAGGAGGGGGLTGGNGGTLAGGTALPPAGGGGGGRGASAGSPGTAPTTSGAGSNGGSAGTFTGGQGGLGGAFDISKNGGGGGGGNAFGLPNGNPGANGSGSGNGGSGGTGCGGGGGGGGTTLASGQGTGGNGGTLANGGGGGGGGGVDSQVNGGFSGSGGVGGFGAGGGGGAGVQFASTVGTGGLGGFGGGRGQDGDGSMTGGGGGGGAAFGGAVFVSQGATFTFQTGSNSNIITPMSPIVAGALGSGGTNGTQAQAIGEDFFVMTGATIKFNTVGSDSLTLNNPIGSETTFNVSPSTMDGGLTKMGSGTLILGAPNVHTGVNKIQEGTVEILADLCLGNTFNPVQLGELGPATLKASVPINNLRTLNVMPNGTATLDTNGNAVTVAGNILMASGSTLSVQAEGGTLSLMNPFNVVSNSILRGKGTIAGTINAAGTIAPGNSIGTITVDGDVNFAPDSILQIEIAPGLNNSSKLVVTGTATIDSASHIDVVQTGNRADYGSTGSYEILTAGTINGMFSDEIFETSTHPAFRFQIQKSNTGITLLYGSCMIALDGLTGNRLKLAKYLDKHGSYEARDVICKLSGSALNNALDHVSSARNGFGSFVTQNMMAALNNMLGARSANQHYMQNLADSSSAPSEVAANEMPRARAKTMAQNCDDYCFWINGFADFAQLNEQKQNPAFNINTDGALLGFEKFFNNGLLGASLGYARNTLHEHDHFGKQEINSYIGGLYGTGYFGKGYCELSLLAAYNQNESTRHLVARRFSANAKGSNHSWQIAPHIELGYDLNEGAFVVEPFIMLDYIANFESAYHEHGAGSLNFKFNDRTSAMLRTEVGVRGYQNWQKCWGICVLQETLGYVNKNLVQGNSLTSAITGTSSTVSLSVLNENQNLFTGGLDLLFKQTGGYFGSVRYDIEAGSGYLSNEVQLTVGKYF